MQHHSPDFVTRQKAVAEPHYSLADAARLFFPSRNVTARSLRTEIAKGDLRAAKIAGKWCVCEGAIAEMFQKKWQDDKGDQDCTSGVRGATVAPTGKSGVSARSQSARAAALMRPKKRSENSLAY